MTTAIPGATQVATSADRLKNLQTRYQALKDARIRDEAELDAAQRELDAAKAEAQAQFGTTDIDELRALHAKTEGENKTAVDAFEAEIGEIETRYQAAKTGTGF